MDIEYTKEIVTKRIQNKETFDKMDYEFRFFYSLGFGTVKLNRKHIAFLRREDRELFVLEDAEKCNKIYDSFLGFVKTAKRHKTSCCKKATGVVVEVEWAKKSIFKKRPNADETLDFFYNIFKEIGFVVEDIRISKVQGTNEDILKLIENRLSGNPELMDLVYDIILKIKDLKKGDTTNIAELINYNPNDGLVDPMIQGTVAHNVSYVCNIMGIQLESHKDSIGGLAYYNKFTKK